MRGEPIVPVERYDTIRKYIVSLLKEYTMSAKEISSIVKIPEREIYDHLEHIRKTLHITEQDLHVEPARCDKCGFVFQKRNRLSKPGKCPLCHSQLILPPLFAIKGA
ncbi:MAG: transcriptional regulator [Syntrophus sp. (in: bacteria)]|nr:transcriptional regulator [Syntrophus sp. (in: bacteria)]